MAEQQQQQSDDKSIAQWRVKQLIKSLEAARGNGTSMISLIIPPKDQIARVNKMLGDEFGTASNIKNRVNRLSVLDAITSTQQRLKLYNKVPPNGLVVYCGTIITMEGKEKKVTIDFEPFRPINTSLYLCVAGDAVVSTSCGLGRRLHDMVNTQSESIVFGSPAGLAKTDDDDAAALDSDSSSILCAGKVEAFLKKGTRDCVTVTLRDGRTLTCTPDHRVLVIRDNASSSSSANPVWVAAEELRPKSDLVVCGLDSPVDDDLATTMMLDSHWTLPGVDHLTMNSFENRARLLAFARLCGLLLTDGALSWNSAHQQFEAHINVGHEMDLESVQADIDLVCGSSAKSHFSVQRSSSTFRIHVPQSLAHMFGSIDGIAVGDRMEQESLWPSFVLDEKTPLCVLREFVGGIMGGSGHAPCISSKRLDQHVIFSQSCLPQHTKAMAQKMAQLCTLLARLGVRDATVQGPTETVHHHNGPVSHRYCVQLPRSIGSIEFDEKVGFRHCVHKQARNSAASVYRRLYNRHVEQRKTFVNLALELREAGCGRDSAIRQAQEMMRAKTEALDETAIRLTSAGLQNIEAGAQAIRAHPDFPSFETVLREIGAIHLFVSDPTSKNFGVPYGKGISPLLLSVENVRQAGEKEVFDISVPTLGSFTANGIVVHNCDNKFHTEPLNELLQSDDRFGFIIVDGNGVLFGTLSGNTREVIHRMQVDLPKKHGRGGQSALRFARLRLEKRHNYLRKVTELSTQFFITNDRPNVAGLVLAGSADFKTELNASDMFDPRLQTKVVAIVDIAYGGDAGFNQAIELASEVLSNVKFIQEKKLVTKYFEEISQDTGKYVFGVDETLRALEMGAVETLIVWENLEITRYTLRNPSTSEVKIIHLNQEQAKDSSHFVDQATGTQYDVETIPLVEWFANNYKKFGCQLEFITNKSQEGAQFCRGFGGIGGLLRYKVEFEVLADNGNDNNDLDLEDFI